MTLGQMWDRIEGREGQWLETTAQRKPFFVETASRGKGVVIIPKSTRKLRPIRADDLNRAYDLWRQNGQVRPVDLRDEGIADWSTAYVASLVQIAATE